MRRELLKHIAGLILWIFLCVNAKAIGLFSLNSGCFDDLIVAGNDKVGSTDYPNGGMYRVRSTPGLIPISNFRCGVIDTDRGYAWLATETVPAHIVKIRLSDGHRPVEYLHYITLSPHYNCLISAVIDTENGFAYFGTYSAPGRVVKIDLGEGDNPPVHVGSVTLEPHEAYLSSAVIDSDKGYAYFGTYTNPGIVVQIKLGEGYALPSRIGATIFELDESALTSAVIDSTKGFAYFGTSTRPGRVIKISLGNNMDPPERIGAVTLELNEEILHSAFIDTNDHSAYFLSLYGRCIKIFLGHGFSSPQRIGSITTSSAQVVSVAVDEINRYAYLGTKSHRFFKLALNRGSELPDVIGYMELETGEFYHIPTLIDVEKGLAYLGTNQNPGRIITMFLGEDDALPERVDSIIFDRDDKRFDRVAYTPNSHYVLFGTQNYTNKILKSKLGFGRHHTRILGRCDLINCFSATMIPQGDYAIFGAQAGQIAKIAVGQGNDPPYLPCDLVKLPSGETDLKTVFFNPLDEHVYFGAGGYYYTGRVVKISPGHGDDPPERIDAIVLDESERRLFSVVFDSIHGYAYYGTYTTPGRIIKVAANPDMPLERIDSLILDNEHSLITAACIDLDNAFAYFFTDTDPIRVVKIALHENGPPEYISSMSLDIYGEFITSFVDSTNGYAYVGVSGNLYASLAKLKLSSGEDPPVMVDIIRFNYDERDLSCSMFYPDEGYAFFAFNGNPGRIVDVTLSQKYYIKGNKINVPEDGNAVSLSFYSHSASGNLRFALYSEETQPNLVWQSDVIENTAADQWLAIDISDRDPPLYLTSGNYWLAWQTDSPADIPGHSTGAQGSGFKVLHEWDSFPDVINVKGQSEMIRNSDIWSAYILIAPLTATPTPEPATPTSALTSTPTSSPAPTSTSTSSPTPAATPEPTAPTSSPTSSPTPVPTVTPEPTAPTQTPTSTPTPDFRLNLNLNRSVFRPGELFLLGVTIENLNNQPYCDHPLFVLLEVQGKYYFYPSWTPEIDFRFVDVTSWIQTHPILCFNWPDINSSADGIAFHAAILNTGLTAVVGNIDTVTFGWSDW
jgi:hypothetical protein